jgi:hypothetical protein
MTMTLPRAWSTFATGAGNAKGYKTFAVRIETSASGGKTLTVMKFGEDPPNIGPTSRALQTFLADQWKMFLQARRSELAGLGIGAFVYYRRVIEHV